jgi:hypothetical protein
MIISESMFNSSAAQESEPINMSKLPILIDVDRDELLAGNPAINLRIGEHGVKTIAREVRVKSGCFRSCREKPMAFGAILVFETYEPVEFTKDGKLWTVFGA